ncbi:MAG: glycosyltransferase [Candidatus Aminicenantes bacterium]|nr:glycosyltransferase [Candidatus Aminicenantes bacterium]
MNISIISTSDIEGGAAIAAFRLLKGLREIQQDAVMAVRGKTSGHPDVYRVVFAAPRFSAEQKIFRSIQHMEIERNRSELSNTRFSFPYPGYDLSRTETIAASDVINLHWIAEFQSVETIAALLQLGKPVVWTLHDEYAYSGGCHYTAGCLKYRRDCSDCPQLKDNSLRIPFHVLQNKLKLWQDNLTIVTPSKWLAECAKKSRVFKNLRVEVIPNSVETHIYKPQAKEAAKAQLGIDPQVVTLLFGAYTGFEKRKGFSKLLAAVKHCLRDPKFKNLSRQGGIKILTYGPPQEDLEELDIEIESTGYVDDMAKLAQIYSAADIFVLPSLEDNLPNTMVEAMACGTPVIGFAAGGIPDMVADGVTGYTAPCPDVEKLGDLILQLVFDENLRREMTLNCRRLIEQGYRLRDQAGNYLELFNDLLKNKKTAAGNSDQGKSSSMLLEKREILLNERNTGYQEQFFDIYRRHAPEVIAGREAQLSQKNEVIKQKDALIKQRDALIKKKDELIARKNEVIKQGDRNILKLYRSPTFRIGKLATFPFRKIKGLYKKIKGPARSPGSRKR